MPAMIINKSFCWPALVALFLGSSGHASVTASRGNTPSGGSYSAEAQQFFDRITDPGTTRKNLYATMIDAVVSCGVWSKLDAWWMLAANSSGNALVNIKNSSFTATEQSTPTFLTDSGYETTNPGVSSAGYLNTTYTIPTDSTNFTQNSAHLSVWVGDSGVTSNNPTAGIQFTVGGVTNQIEHHASGTGTTCRINESSESGQYSNTTFYTMFTANRSSSTAEQCYVAATSVGSITNTSGTPTSADLYLVRANGAAFANDAIVRSATVGGSLSSGDVTCLYDAQHAYLQTVAGIP